MRTSFHGPTTQSFNECERITTTWKAMEACVMRGGPRSMGGNFGPRDLPRLPIEIQGEVRPAPAEVPPTPKAPAPAPAEPPKVQVWGPVAPTIPPAPTMPPIGTAPASLAPAAPLESSAPGRPITAQEAEQMAKRASEQSGAKCHTKVYGGGAAITVCE